MGLFGFGKKSAVESPSRNSALGNLGSQGEPDFNLGLDNPSYGNQSMDPNSGLKLADLNAPQQTMDFGGQSGGTDSFGNIKPQQKFENFEYKQSQQYASQDNSKDFELILAKLDTIRSEITNINHRLDNIERLQKETPQKKYPW